MNWLNDTDSPLEQEVLIAVADISHFLNIVKTKSNLEVFYFLQTFYKKVELCLEESSGRALKYIGDSVFMVFPPNNINLSLKLLKKMKSNLDNWLLGENFQSTCQIKVHIGRAAVGMVGENDTESIDIFGSVVNELFMLPAGEFVLSKPLARLINRN